MCGIYGNINFEKDLNYQREFSRLMQQEHRGPDGQEIVLIDKKNKIELKPTALSKGEYYASLGHTRLSIIGLSKKYNQPLLDSEQKLLMVFNGEIYNYIELGEKISRTRGVKVDCTSDAMVLLEGYKEYGNSVFGMLDGMYAVSFYDLKRKKLTLARDPFGQKFLYYKHSEKGVSFSSDMRSLVEFDDALSKKGLSSYIVNGYIASPYSLFDSINKLQPGEVKVFKVAPDEGSVGEVYSSFIKRKKNRSNYGRAKIIDNPETKFIMRSDVPFTALMSGGLDSTIGINTLLSSNETLEVFTYDQNNPEYDEKINYLTQKFKQRIMINKINPEETDFLSEVEILKNALDEPVDSGSSVELTRLFHFISDKGFKLVITGDGADEIFLGYENYRKYAVNRILEKLKIRKFLPVKSKGTRCNSLLNSVFKDNISAPQSSLSLNQYIDHYENTKLPDRMLFKIDRLSMYYGIEARPFFTRNHFYSYIRSSFFRRIITLVFPKYHLKKYLLLNGFSRKFVNSKKLGFTSSSVNLISTDILKFMLDVINDSHIASLIDVNILNQIFEMAIKKKNKNCITVMRRLFILVKVYEKYEKKDCYEIC